MKTEAPDVEAPPKIDSGKLHEAKTEKTPFWMPQGRREALLEDISGRSKIASNLFQKSFQEATEFELPVGTDLDVSASNFEGVF